MPIMAAEPDMSFPSFSLPSLAGNPLYSPRQTPSRRSSRQSTVSPTSSPAPQSLDKDENEGAVERLSLLDPRRFTPTLHANLVSEILSLRREVESKDRLVLGLEETISSVREDNAKLNEAITTSGKETRTLKRQMQMLEGGTLSALEELGKERDNTLETLHETKKRLEASQRKVKSQEDAVDRTNALWENDRDKWDLERRNLDRKVHVVEGRLKTILAEIEAAGFNGGTNGRHRPGSALDDRPRSRAGGGAKSSASHRRGSSVSTDGATRRVRLSYINEGRRGDASATLADELEFDDDFDDAESNFDEPTSPEALPEESMVRRSISAQSHRQSLKARRLLGLTIADDEENEQQAISDAADLQMQPARDKRAAVQSYVDSATQFSPPQSPALLPQTNLLHTIAEADDERSLKSPKIDLARDDAANNSPPQEWLTRLWSGPSMVSSACQTVEQPPSPPHTPTDAKRSTDAPFIHPRPMEMSTSSTQTTSESAPSLPETAAASRTDSPNVPVIAIHPPTSSGSNRHSVVLPPHTKNASCQASLTSSVRSVSVQTEEIRIDQRALDKLPAHLQPSAISSKPNSPTPEAQELRNAKVHGSNEPKLKLRVPSLPNRSQKRQPVKAKEDPFTADHSDDERAPSRLSAGDGNISDADSFVTREPVRKTLSKIQNSWKLVPQKGDDEAETGTAIIFGTGAKGSGKATPSSKFQAQLQGLKKNEPGKVAEPINTGKGVDVRKTAMIYSGTAAHIHRTRSPSAPAAPGAELRTINPPFPVPTRSSSRNIPWGSSEGTVSPTPQTVSFFGADQPAKQQKRPPTKKPVLRKIRSATNESYDQHRSGSQSPARTSSSSFVDGLQLPAHPPLPNDGINSNHPSSFRPGHKGQARSSVASAAASAGSDQTTVVDAIAQTMIGEWMWKYVRRRKTFGLTDGGGDETTNGLRHQRWVWLAPYDRAVMWSTKQPMSGPALMGKSGRKLTIQSVLDVRDESPSPKGAASPCFGRSILILTPQRALKFTATSRERHYVWLSALSFLSHSSVVPSELGSPQPAVPSASTRLPPSGKDPKPLQPQMPPPPPPPTTSLRRHPIRDSIRIAKGKARPLIPNGGRRAYTDPQASTPSTNTPAPSKQSIEDEEGNDSGAEPPLVPRTSTNSRSRTRSNTTGTKPPSSYRRSFSSSAKPSLHSLHSRLPSTQHSIQGSHSLMSRGESEASYTSWVTDGPHGAGRRSSRPGSGWAGGDLPMSIGSVSEAAGSNFFDAVGTRRMEAFVSGSMDAGRKASVSASGAGTGAKGGPISSSLVGDTERKSYRTREGRKKDLKYWGAGSEVRVGGGGSNPFEGF